MAAEVGAGSKGFGNSGGYHADDHGMKALSLS